MHQINALSLQANIIFLLLALIGSTAIIKHPGWFGGTPEVVMHVDALAARVAGSTP
jgi:hypothetical protein